MAKFDVEIRTTFYYTVEVEAENVFDAKQKALEKVNDGEIDATDTDNFNTDISGVWFGY